MRRLWLSLALSLAAPFAVSASGAPSPSGSNGPDAFLGYSYTKAGEAGLHGWQLTGTHPLGSSFRVVADLSGHYGSFAQADLSQLTFLAGGRWTPRRERLVPFVQALLGAVRTKTSASFPGGSVGDSDTDWGTAFGGGIDYRFSGRWAARAQLDLLVLRAEGTWETDPRFSLGVVYRLGK